MNKLYVIGNGFDLYHGLDTSYSSFGLFLKDLHSDIYDYLVQYHGISEISSDGIECTSGVLWSDFEAALAYVDYEAILEDHSDYLASPGSEDFNDRDWGAFQIEIERVIDEITVHLFEAFHDYILSIEIPDSIESELLCLNKNGIYLNFNYTDSLEKLYKIPRDKILYIHNQATRDNELILGHGVNPEELEPKEPEPPSNLSDEDYERWAEMMSDGYDFSFELGKTEVANYFTKSHKDTLSIIKENEAFFESLKNIKQVYILGHSLSEVDDPYFRKIVDSACRTTTWVVTYYTEEEKSSHKEALVKCGVCKSMINMLEMSNLVQR